MKTTYISGVALLVIFPTLIAYGEEVIPGQRSEHVQQQIDQLESAIAKKNSSDYAGAIALMNPIISWQESAASEIYYERGECYYALGEYEKAEEDYRKTLPFSTNGISEYCVGKCLFAQVKYYEALEMFSVAESKFPEDKNPHSRFMIKGHIASTLYEIKRYDESLKLFLELEKEFPDEDHTSTLEFKQAIAIKQENESNQRLEPIVKTPVDEVEAQSTQAHP